MTRVIESLFFPRRMVPYADRLPLGQFVHWTHRAVVVRWIPKDNVWIVVEGFQPGGWRPSILLPDQEHIDYGLGEDPLGDIVFRLDKPEWNEPNQTILVWPEESCGHIIGLVQKGIGVSSKAIPSSSNWTGYDEGEPGFDASGFMNLYAVKYELQGVHYMLCPWWAVRSAE